ncbi:MAG: hypothetical protein H5T96_09555 [Tissierellales bacterium]|nr:hypothetical protein [Tissierellales bacterium]
MKKISRDAYDAFMSERDFHRDNTSVTKMGNGTVWMELFNNRIARKEGSNIYISDGDYKPTATTRDRLSAFVNISIYKGEFIINNRIRWDGKWTNINKFN